MDAEWDQRGEEEEEVQTISCVDPIPDSKLSLSGFLNVWPERD